MVYYTNNEDYMLDKNQLLDSIKVELDKLIDQSKQSASEVKRVAATQAWKILQLAVAISVQLLENIAVDLSGPDKKTVAMEAISKFYDNVFKVVDVPFVPSILEPWIHKYTKAFLMALVGASIDAMVTTFKQIGLFKEKNIKSLSAPKPKTIKSRKKRK